MIHEMKAVAEITNLKLAEVCLLHLVFELYSGCTAIVANSSKGPYLARTLDWDMSVTPVHSVISHICTNVKTICNFFV